MKKIPCEIFTRVAGYFRPVGNFNKGKKAEYEDRKTCKKKAIEALRESKHGE